MQSLTSWRITHALIISLVLFVVAQPSVTLSLSQSASQSAERIELTERDLFEIKTWDSTRVDVVGFRLGMTRQEANANAHRNGLHLIVFDLGETPCSGEKCEVCDVKMVCPGIVLDFSHDDHVTGVEVSKIPEDGAAVVRKAAITSRFKGKTRLFFNRYSNDLRLKLLGHEDSRDRPSDKNPLYKGMVTYKYPRLGVNVFVSPNPHGPESTSDLVVTLVAPAANARN